MITGENINAGDVLIGLASSGVHSNGFSLIRKIIADNNLDLTAKYVELGSDKTLGEVLLTPTRIYTGAIMNMIAAVEVKGMAHITGGGFVENIPRILPQGLGAKINHGSWDIPAIFRFIQANGGVNEMEMFNLYNMGVGMVIVVAQENVDTALEVLATYGETASVIGHVMPGEGVAM